MDDDECWASANRTQSMGAPLPGDWNCSPVQGADSDSMGSHKDSLTLKEYVKALWQDWPVPWDCVECTHILYSANIY